jgi:hypothetical protein
MEKETTTGYAILLGGRRVTTTMTEDGTVHLSKVSLTAPQNSPMKKFC